MTAALRVEERSQSCGSTITSRRDELLTVHVLADRRPAPRDLTLQVLMIELQSRGLSVAIGEADAIARRILAAEVYRPSGESCVDVRD
jgi:hypothetical protein